MYEYPLVKYKCKETYFDPNNFGVLFKVGEFYYGYQTEWNEMEVWGESTSWFFTIFKTANDTFYFTQLFYPLFEEYFITLQEYREQEIDKVLNVI